MELEKKRKRGKRGGKKKDVIDVAEETPVVAEETLSEKVPSFKKCVRR